MDKHCLVSFSIGKRYFDNILCEVLTINVCHILLGRPWQHNMSVLYDKRHNTYALGIKRKCVVLAFRREHKIVEG